MTRRERVVSAINHVETDPVPWCVDFTVEMEENLRERMGQEWLDAVGSCMVTVDHPHWHFYNIADDFATADEPERLPQALGAGRGFEEFHEELDLTGARDRFVVVRYYACIFEKAWQVRGFCQVLSDMVANPSFAERLLDKIVEMDHAVMTLTLESTSLDGMLFGSDWGGQDKLLMNPDVWRRILKPRYAKLFSLVRDAEKHLLVHSCGNITEIIPDLIEMGVHVLNPIQPECMDIRMLKREFGKDICFWGGISTQQTLPFGTPEEVKEETREVLDFMREGGGYILAPAQHIQSDVPMENIEAFLEIASV